MRMPCRPAPVAALAQCPWSAANAWRAVVGAALLLGIPAALAAQNAPADFTLPPASAPQPEGPADERAGVPIPPRVIPQERSQSPSAQPARSAPAPSPASAAPAPSSQPSTAAVPDGNPARLSPPTGTASPRPSVPDENRRAPLPSTLDEVQPPGTEDFLIGEGEWVDVMPDGSGAAAGLAPAGPDAIAPGAPLAEQEVRKPYTWLWAMVALLIGVLAVMAWMARGNRRLPSLADGQDSELANRVRETIRARPPEPALALAPSRTVAKNPSWRPAQTDAGVLSLLRSAELPDPKPAEPPVIDLSLDIFRATRSFMMFTLEYRLTLWNRSERAVRDLGIDARLVCAKRAGVDDMAARIDQPLATIERIGPHQRRTISATSQLALSDIEAMHQGAKPLFVPLLHIALEGPGGGAITRSYVIGSPSMASAGPIGLDQAGLAQAGRARLHPIALDTPPGGIEGLRASEIRQQPLSEPA